MTDTQRKIVCAILTGPIDESNGVMREVLSTIAVSETYDLEPLIDDWLEQAELRGKFQQMLENADSILRSRRAAA